MPDGVEALLVGPAKLTSVPLVKAEQPEFGHFIGPSIHRGALGHLNPQTVLTVS